MSEQIREQVSAFLDGELPNQESELLLKRLTRDADLRESFGRYALIGETLRGGGSLPSNITARGFAARVNRAIDGEPVIAATAARRGSRWWRPLAGAAVAAGVTAVAVVSFQQRVVAPAGFEALPVTARTAGGQSEPISYTVPRATDAAALGAPRAMPAARLTNYVFAHSKYSSVLGQENVLSALLTDADEQDAALKDAHAAP